MSSLGAEDNDTIAYYIPTKTQIGIFLAVGLQGCALALCWRFRNLLLFLLDASQYFFLAIWDGLRRFLIELGGERLPLQG
jgi:hypothetical protein